MFNVNQIALTAEAFMSEHGYDMERAIDESLKKHGIEKVSEEEREAVREQLKRHEEAKAEEEENQALQAEDDQQANNTENELEEVTTEPEDLTEDGVE